MASHAILRSSLVRVLDRHIAAVTIKLLVHINYELERLILGFGEAIEVIAPPLLRKRIQKKIKAAASNYIK